MHSPYGAGDASLWAVCSGSADPTATGSVDVGRRDPSHKRNPMRALRPMPAWGGAGVPHGCRIRDGRRREPVSALRCRLREAGSRFDTLTLDGAVNGGAADTEELGDLEGAV